MTEKERELLADLAVSEKRLSERTRERDEAELAVVTSELELKAIQLEFSDVATNLSTLALQLSQRTSQLAESDKELANRTIELEASTAALEAMKQEKDCFVAALLDLKSPIVGSNRILEYIATGTIAPGQQSEILRQLIESNKTLVVETDRLAAAFLKLSEHKSELDDRKDDLADRTGELKEANAELKAMREVMQQREDFVMALTHDLKNPLIGSTTVLEHLVSRKVAPEQQFGMLRQVIESNKTMLHLIWNMLEVYRSDSGCLTPVHELIDLTELMRQSLDEFSFAIQQKKIVVVSEIQQALTVHSDRSLLRRVLTNLLDNGVKFTPEGGQLTVQISLERNCIRISVTNSGTTMSDDQSEHLFERFWQTPHGRGYGLGTGLGLFLSKRIMQALNGSIDFVCEEEIGTRFTITLPLTQTLPESVLRSL